MKPSLILILSLGFSLSAIGQSTFKWSDTSFTQGETRTIGIRDCGKPGWSNFEPFYDCYDSSNKLTYDTIINFLRKNPKVIVQIGAYTDGQGSNQHNINYSYRLASTVIYNIISKGIDSARLSPKGYGNTRPIVPNNVIDTMKTKEEKYDAYRKNRRYDISILGLEKNGKNEIKK